MPICNCCYYQSKCFYSILCLCLFYVYRSSLEKILSCSAVEKRAIFVTNKIMRRLRGFKSYNRETYFNRSVYSKIFKKGLIK